jgi:hypothetical protein
MSTAKVYEKILVDNNVYKLELRNVEHKWLTDVIHQLDRKPVITGNNIDCYFAAGEQHIYNTLVDNARICIDDLISIMQLCKGYFTKYSVSRKMQIMANKYINSIPKYMEVWTNLFSRYDYNLRLYETRTLPYFNSESKDWAKSNMDAIAKDYPDQLFRDANAAHINLEHDFAPKDTDYELEESVKGMDNNFLEWSILPVDQYTNITLMTKRIVTLYDVGLQREATMLFCALMLSPKDCHCIKSIPLWQLFKPLMQKNRHLEELIKYCYMYSMYILRQEETIMFSQVDLRYRVLFTLDEAASLPLFHNTHSERNPYILQLTGNTRLNSCVPFYLHGKRKINSEEEFKRRFDIATGGCFRGVDLKALGAAVTGSILIPCVHTSPLEELFVDIKWHLDLVRQNTKQMYTAYGLNVDKLDDSISPMGITHDMFPTMVDPFVTTADRDFWNYLEYYYPSYASLQDKDFISEVLKKPTKEVNLLGDQISYADKNDTLEGHVQNSINSFGSNLNLEEDGFTVPNNLPSMEKTKKPRKQRSKNKTNNKQDKKSKSKEKSREKSKEKKDKKEKKEKKSKKPKDETKTPMDKDHKVKPKIEYNQLADIDVSITTKDLNMFKKNVAQLYEAIKKNCAHRGMVYIKEIRTMSSIKYKVYGPGLPRPMDIFRIPYEPAKMVKKFHVHAVKMYYDNQVTLFRSCIASLLSGVGESYRWFSCNKTPADVLLKYAQRGISIILNQVERESISNYITGNDRWGEVLKYLKITADKIYCNVTYKHPFFRPNLYGAGIRLSLRNFVSPADIHDNNLLISIPKSLTPVGDFKLKDNTKWHVPNHTLIVTTLDYIDSHPVEEDDALDRVDELLDESSEGIDLNAE